MKEIIIHKVKIMGQSEYTECGRKFINSGLSATQNGEVTCKECLMKTTPKHANCPGGVGMKEILIKAVETLKNNFVFRRGVETKSQDFKEFSIGIYNRFDEIGLIYSSLQNISFNEAIKELELGGWMEELKKINTPKHAKEKQDE